MVKLVYCIRRREDVPEDEFHRYWLDEHGPLVRSVAGAIGALGASMRPPPRPQARRPRMGLVRGALGG